MPYDALVRETARRLRHAGIDDPMLEARLLVMHASGLSRTDLLAQGMDVVPAESVARLEPLVSRRLSREPLQHIVGRAHFYGLELICDRRGLIPRSDSEVVVDVALRLLPEEVDVCVADLGTGSGCLLAAILANRPRAVGIGVDTSADAVALASQNMALLNLQLRADVLRCGWRDWTDWHRADLIISNPPYIPSADLSTLQPEVREHDPLQALDGGSDGLAAYREIVDLAARKMKAGGWLVLEIGFDQREDVLRLLAENGLSDCGSERDLGGHDRVVWGQKSAR